MTPSDLDRLEALARAATPGPWEARPDPQAYPNWYLVYADKAEPPLLAQVLTGTSMYSMRSDLWPERSRQAKLDATFIAAANPSTVLRLIAECRRKM